MTETAYGQYGTNGTHAADVGQLDPLDRRPLADLAGVDPASLGARGAGIPWGDEGHQIVNPVIAAGMLRLLRARNAKLWAELHYEAATGEALATYTRKRTRKP